MINALNFEMPHQTTAFNSKNKLQCIILKKNNQSKADTFKLKNTGSCYCCQQSIYIYFIHLCAWKLIDECFFCTLQTTQIKT